MSSSLVSWIQSNRKLAYGIVVALLVLGVGVSIMTSRSAQKENEAANALFIAQRALEKEMQALTPVPEKPEKKDAKAKVPAAPAASPEFKALDVDKTFAGGIEKLKAVESKYPSTRAAQEARTLVGGVYLKHGHPNRAQEFFERAVKDAHSGAEKAMALAGLATALENQGKLKEALDPLDRAVNQGEQSLQAELLLHLARVARAAGDSARAKQALQKITTLFPNTDYAQSAENLQAQF